MSKKKSSPKPVLPFDFKQVKLFVATPMYGGQGHGFYFRSLLQLQVIGIQAQMPMTIAFLFNESLITRGRNKLVSQFLDTDFTHLLFIDSDINFNPHHIMQMIATDKDVICGLYPKKEINWHSVVNAVHRGVEPNDLRYHTGNFVVNLVGYTGHAAVPTNEPCEIWEAGTGCMLIKRTVLEKMMKKTRYYINDVGDSSGKPVANNRIYQFFTESIQKGTGRLLSEDYHFCEQWRKMGGKIYAAPWVELAHIGTYPFEGKMLQAPKAEAEKMLRDIKKKRGKK